MNENYGTVVEYVTPATNPVSYKTVAFRNIHDKNIACQFRLAVRGRTNIDLILKASHQLKNPNDWEFYEIRNH